MLGSVREAEDAVQQAWLRLRRSDADAIIDRPGPGAAAHTGRRQGGGRSRAADGARFIAYATPAVVADPAKLRHLAIQR